MTGRNEHKHEPGKSPSAVPVQSLTLENEGVKLLIPDPFSSYVCKFEQIASRISVFDLGSPDKLLGNISHFKMTCMGLLKSQDILVSVSNAVVMIWDLKVLRLEKHKEINATPKEQFKLPNESQLSCWDATPPKQKAQLHVLPGEQRLIVVETDSSQVQLINLKEQKSEIVKLPFKNFKILDSALVGDKYLAILGGQVKLKKELEVLEKETIYLYDITKPDFLKKFDCRLEMPKAIRLIVWPEGHIWGTLTKEKNVKGAEIFQVSLWKFNPDKSLSKLTTVSNVDDNHITAEGELAYYSLKENSSEDKEYRILAFNPKTQETTILYTSKEPMHYIHSTKDGMVISDFKGNVFLCPSKDLTPQLTEFIQSTSQFSRGPASIIAGYVGLFTPSDPKSENKEVIKPKKG